MKKLFFTSWLTLSFSWQVFAAQVVCLPEKPAFGNPKSYAEKAVISADRKSVTLVLDSTSGDSVTGNLVPTEDGLVFEEWFASQIGLRIVVTKTMILVNEYDFFNSPQTLVCGVP